MEIAQFMSSPVGRAVRAFLGVALIVIGISMGSAGGWILAAVGLVPLAAGVGNFCLIAPILGVPFSGSKLRR